MAQSEIPSPDSGALAATIGAKVKAQRAAFGLTLDALAEQAGVSRRLLVSIEKGEANPSVGTLLKISSALAIALPTLVDMPEPTTIRVVRSGEGAALWAGPRGGTGVLLVGSATPDVAELWEWTLMPGESHASDRHPRGTRESLHVLQGAVTVTVGAQVVTAKRGDAVGFAGDLPHTYANHGASAARFSLAVFEPSPRPVTSRSAS